MTGLRYSPLHVTEVCGEMQGKFKVGLARLKSTLQAEKTARVHRLFGASNYVNCADKAEKFSGNSSVFKWKNRKISSSKRAKYYGH